jgi:hypothetical protein
LESELCSYEALSYRCLKRVNPVFFFGVDAIENPKVGLW